jgi:thimet oligopeptidase
MIQLKTRRVPLNTSLLRKQFLTALLSGVFVLTSCSSKDEVSPQGQNDPGPAQKTTPPTAPPGGILRSDYAKGEVTALCQASIETAEAELNAIAAVPADKRTTENTLMAFENAMADLGDRANPLTFMGYVSTDEEISQEGADCENALGQIYVQIFTRRDLYQALNKAKTRNSDQSRLLEKTLESFESNGLKLDDVKLAEVRALKSKLSALETEYSANLNSDDTSVLFKKSELDGMTEDFITSQEVDADGNLVIPANESTYPSIMRYAVKPATRKKMMLAYLSRAGSKNSKLLSEAVVLRAQIAKVMGYKTWADYRTDGRMAQTGETALKFLNNLKTKLAQRSQDDLNKLLKFKQETLPNAKNLDQWDISFYTVQLQKRDFNLDQEKVSEYFPTDVVIAGMFEVYSEMLGVKFQEVQGAPLWDSSVKLYEIRNTADNKLVAYFYADFYPRKGKYDHAAAFPLISGRKLANGEYSIPVASIVSNLTPPLNNKPSLLSFDDVETIFHEFGHIMHQTLTKAPYASLSGTSVAQDFVEAPSQMLENWTIQPEILNKISGHYLDHTQKLPTNLLQQLIAVKDFNQGYSYTKQLTYALFDMTLHTQDQALDVDKVYLDTYRDVMGQEPLAGQQFPASFGHMMGGYDAGYYGYLWSEVYAQDMFTMFPKNDITSPSVGMSYRENILEPGNMKDALDLLRAFLGREPNSDAFFKKLNL